MSDQPHLKKHLGPREMKYKFVDIETLVADFLRDVEAMS